jgi:hypothetical protein
MIHAPDKTLGFGRGLPSGVIRKLVAPRLTPDCVTDTGLDLGERTMCETIKELPLQLLPGCFSQHLIVPHERGEAMLQNRRVEHREGLKGFS